MKIKFFIISYTLLISSLVYGDWSTLRHDPRRTGFVFGHSDLDKVSPKWRYYLGSSLDRTQYWVDDVNGDGVKEIVFISGGKLIAKLPNDSLVWQTPLLDLFRIARVLDIDKDGIKEICARATIKKVFIFSGRDGSILWEAPEGSVGTPSKIMFYDFNGDGVEDLYLQNCTCCTYRVSGDPTIVYSFANGFNNVQELFRIDPINTCGDSKDSFVDIDSDGIVDIVRTGIYNLWVNSSQDGSLLYDYRLPPNEGTFKYNNGIWIEDVDANGFPEIFIFTNMYREGTDWFGKRAYVIEYSPTSHSLQFKWQFSAQDPVNDIFRFKDYSVADVNGDSIKEVVVSIYESQNLNWILYILDSRDGTVLDSLLGLELYGITDIDGDGIPEILGMDNNILKAYKYLAPQNMFVELWSIQDEMPIDKINYDLYAYLGSFMETFSIDLNSDGIKELITTKFNRENKVYYLKAWNGAVSPPQELYRFEPLNGAILFTWELFENVTENYPQIVTAKSDGYIVVLDNSLNPTNTFNDPVSPRFGVKIGGYYGNSYPIDFTPITMRYKEGETTQIFVTDSRKYLLRLNPQNANMVTPPVLVWERGGEMTPTGVDINNDGIKEIVTIGNDGSINLLDFDGNRIWSARVIPNENYSILNDTLPGDADNDGIIDIFVSWYDNIRFIRYFNVIKGDTGTILWSIPYSYGSGSSKFPFSVADLNNTGNDDLIVTAVNLVLIDGLTGQELQRYNVATGYDLPVVYDYDNDTQYELLLQGGHHPPRLLETDFSEVWVSQVDDRYSGSHGTIVPCNDGYKFITPKFNSPFLQRFDLERGIIEEEKVFASGRIFEDEESAILAGATTGYLSEVAGHEDLAGIGTPIVVFGSTDGWLYLVSACNFSIVDAVNMGYPVGSPILDDIDDDGKSEIVVMVGDGYLYGFDRKNEISPPEWIYETDGTYIAHSPQEDLDEVETFDTLWANWDNVENAIYYEVTVFTENHSLITDWLNSGQTTSITITGLPLRYQGRYFFAVRAVSENETSAETLSDGVIIVDKSPPWGELTVVPSRITPDGDGVDDFCKITVTMYDKTSIAQYRWVILTQDGAKILESDYIFAEGSEVLAQYVWDGKDKNGSVVEPGEYLVGVEILDVGGHMGIVTEPIVVDSASLDSDDDGVPDIVDNCVNVPNPDQSDLDGDYLGDLCDSDIDGDNVSNEEDCVPYDIEIYPGNQEVCDDNLDNDCDGDIDSLDEECQIKREAGCSCKIIDEASYLNIYSGSFLVRSLFIFLYYLANL